MDVFSCSDGLVLTGHHRLVDEQTDDATAGVRCFDHGPIQTRIPAGTIIHSDRGSQYCSKKYQQLLQLNKLVCSMSRKGCCYDNAAMESFFHTLKVELVHRDVYVTRQQARQNIFEYIETYYNRQRRHSAIGNQIPMQYELKMSA